MRLKKFLLAINFLFLLLTPFYVFPQDPHPSFRHFTVEDGLPSSEVYQVKQDSKGYLWFATGNGVSRYNGYEFENFSMNDGLPDNTVFEIFEDHSGKVWFVPISCKLSYFENGKIVQFKYNDQLQKLLNNPIKTSFGVDEQGNIFIGVLREGIFKISPKGKIDHLFSGKYETNKVEVIQPNPSFLIYSNSQIGYDDSVHFNTSVLNGQTALKGNRNGLYGSDRMIITQKKNIVCNRLNTIYILKNLQEIKMHQLPKRCIWIYEDRDQDLWVGTYLGGVFHFHNGDLDDQSVYLQGLPVNSVIEDNEQGYWFATEGDGVYYTPSKKILTYDQNVGLSGNKINCLAGDGNIVYAASQTGFLNQIHDSVISTININKDGSPSVSSPSLFNDPLKKRIWLSGGTTCGWYQGNRLIFSNNISSFHKIVITGGQNYWLASSMGLTEINNDKIVFNSHTKWQLKRFNALVKWNDSTLLAGSLDGLWQFNIPTQTFVSLSNKNPLLKERILDLAFTGNGMLLIATKGKGLLIYDMNSRVYQLDEKKGLCGNNVYRVITDGNWIWTATNKGVNRICITKKEPLVYTLSSFTNIDGVASNEANDLLTQNQKIWIATNKGVSFFDESAEFSSGTVIPIYITQVMINDSIKNSAGHYFLEHDQNNIRIRFIGISYRDPGSLEYRYKMSGLDSSWIYTKSREVQFTTLPPNNYTFYVSVRSPHSQWSNPCISIPFTIDAPFWQKWWFILLALSGVLLLIMLLFRYRVKLIQKKEEHNTELNRSFLNLKMKALRAQMNPHFTFNVMNSIQHFILSKDNESAHRYLSKFSRLLRAILNNSEYNSISVDEELKALELYLELEAMRFENSFDYSINIDKKINTSATQLPSMLIQPYVENAIKHGILPLKKKGNIRIDLIKDGDMLKCIIIDNGIGRTKAAEIRKEDGHSSMGSSITRERLTVLNAISSSDLSETTTDLYDEQGNACGTKVEIFIPLKNATDL